jgi:glycolate oxidase FAD binding subunit
MTVLTPTTADELADALRSLDSRGQPIPLEGAGSKRMMGGAALEAEVRIATTGLNHVLEYDPRELTVSVEAGLPWRKFTALLAEYKQMVPLDPPFADLATVGGVVAANTSGPRRRLYGTARDQVIGMKFATLDGRVVESGGMVVKNVAGLDMQKLLIGSFGTLAAIASVNFRVAPIPEATATYILEAPSAQGAMVLRDHILGGVLQPAAIDLLNPQAAARARVGGSAFLLAVRAGGTERVLARYRSELAPSSVLEGDGERSYWRAVEEFVPQWMYDHRDGAAVRISHVMPQLAALLESTEAPCVARAGNGVAWICFDDAPQLKAWIEATNGRGWQRVVEYSSPIVKETVDLWPDPAEDLAMMRQVKQLFDPRNLLNRGRLYGRI